MSVSMSDDSPSANYTLDLDYFESDQNTCLQKWLRDNYNYNNENDTTDNFTEKITWFQHASCCQCVSVRNPAKSTIKNYPKRKFLLADNIIACESYVNLIDIYD